MSISSFPLDQLGLTPHQLAACNRAGLVNAADVLLPSISDLNRKLKFSRLEGVTDLVQAVSRAIVPSPVDLRTGDLTRKNGNSAEGHVEVLSSRGGIMRMKEMQGDWVGTGDVGLDGLLGGGLRVGSITEITGESAAGKSHWCLSLALAAQIPTLTTNPGAAMILTSEREIATDRMIELAHHLLESHDPQGEMGIRPRDMLDNVLSNIVQDITMLEHTLTYKVPFILRSRSRPVDLARNPLLGGRSPPPAQSEAEVPGQGDGQESEEMPEEPVVSRLRPESGILPVRLLIIDSITALIRGADSSYAKSSSIGLTERSRHLCAVADKLKMLAVEFNLAVLVINQVSDVFTRTPTYSSSQPTSSLPLSQFYTEGAEPPMLYATQSRHFSGQTESLKKEASLGIVWANAVNTRIMLSRTGRRRMIDPKDLSRRLKRRRPQEEDDTPPYITARVAGGLGPVVDDTKPTLIRRAHVVFSGFASPATIDYVITTSGIHSIPDSYRLMDIAETIKRKERMARAILYGQDGDERDEAWTPVRVLPMPPVQPAVTDDPGAGAEGPAEGGSPEWEDEYGEEVFDDLGELPAEFWEGRMDEVVTEPLAIGTEV